ncbi:hypothetical protein D3C72_1840560 [compost metagenome]
MAGCNVNDEGGAKSKAGLRIVVQQANKIAERLGIREVVVVMQDLQVFTRSLAQRGIPVLRRSQLRSITDIAQPSAEIEFGQQRLYGIVRRVIRDDQLVVGKMLIDDRLQRPAQESDLPICRNADRNLRHRPPLTICLRMPHRHALIR